MIWGPAQNQPKSLCPQRVAAFLPSPSFIVSLAAVFRMSRWGELGVTSKKPLRGRLHLSVLSSSFAPRKSHFLQLLPHSFLPLSLSFFIVMSIYALFWNSFMVHPLLHARPRELAFLYCNITMTAGLFSYRVLLSDLDKRWCRTSAGSHFGRF